MAFSLQMLYCSRFIFQDQACSNANTPHMINSWSGYSQVPSLLICKSLTSKLNYASSFPVTQLSKAHSFKYKTMVCNSMATTDVELQAKLTSNVFFDVDIGGDSAGRIVTGFLGDMFLELLRALCTVKHVVFSMAYEWESILYLHS